jgi:hypothetical protein
MALIATLYTFDIELATSRWPIRIVTSMSRWRYGWPAT